MDKEWFMQHVNCAVVNAEANADVLSHVVHEGLMDLAVVAKYQGKDGIPHLVDMTVCQSMHMTGGEIMALAHTNTDQQSFKCQGIIDVIGEQMIKMGLPEGYVQDYTDMMRVREGAQLYVLSNDDCKDGAAVMTNKQALQGAYEHLGEDYYILPSSVDEVLLVRQSENLNAEELEEIVRSVNNDQVPEHMRLSDHIYSYDGQTQKLSMVAVKTLALDDSDAPRPDLAPTPGKCR